jgi:hypothetical protein
LDGPTVIIAGGEQPKCRKDHLGHLEDVSYKYLVLDRLVPFITQNIMKYLIRLEFSGQEDERG